MWCEEAGEPGAPVVLLIHGGGVAAWMWQDHIATLAQDFHVLAPDLPGHDHSADEDFTSSEAVVEELASRLAGLRADGRSDITVVGFSLGGQIAISLASQHPELVDRVVVVSALAAPVPHPGLNLFMVRAAAPLARRPGFALRQARSMFVPDKHLGDYLRTVRSLSKDSLVALTRANLAFRIPPGWSRFPGPALLMAGGAEHRLVVRGMEDLHHALPSSQLDIVPGARHGIPLQGPQWFATGVAGWIGRQSAPS